LYPRVQCVAVGRFAGVYSTLDSGAHLFKIMPKVWTIEVGESRVKEVLVEGFDLLKMGWERDDVALRNSVVGALMD
jgi:hypothetical protein